MVIGLAIARDLDIGSSANLGSDTVVAAPKPTLHGCNGVPATKCNCSTKQRLVHVYANEHEIKILHAADTLDGGDVLPGFSLAVADIFT